MDSYHLPVLLGEVMANLEVKAGEWYLDCTLGDGGYGVEILAKGGKYFGIDQDPEAVSRTEKRFRDLGLKKEDLVLKRGNFKDLSSLVEKRQFMGVIFDLGVSSLQLEQADRGFAFSKEAKLDMRMDPNLAVSAYELVNGLNKGELAQLLEKYGEVINAKKVAAKIVEARQAKPITTTTELAYIVAQAGPAYTKIHPATTVFQALRMAVNDELNNLKEALPQALEVASAEGKILVISFHSGEDRIVKNIFKDWQEQKLGQILTDKPVQASDSEVDSNPRSRSAKLRVFQKS